MAFSERSNVDRETNALTRARQDAEARGSLLDLTASNPAAAELPYDVEALRAALSGVDPSRYVPHPRGAIEARRALAELGLAPSAETVLLTASTSEAYAYLFPLLADRGDEILVPAPSYPLLEHLAHATDVQLTSYELVYDGAWHPRPAELFDRIGERTRAIVAVSPNNPTGHFLDPDTAADLGALGMPLIIDEVFAAYPLDASPPPRAPAEGLTFRLDGLSKRAALPGLKLAWTSVEGPPAEVEEALARLELMSDSFLSPNVPAQLALPALLEASRTTTDAIRARTAANLAALRAEAEGSALTVPRVEAGWYAPVRVPATRTDEAWCLALLERGVATHPGYFYDFAHDEAWLVLSLLTPEPTFARGLAIVSEVVSSLSG